MKTVEFALSLSKSQKAIIDKWLESLRWLWNQGLELLLELEKFSHWHKFKKAKPEDVNPEKKDKRGIRLPCSPMGYSACAPNDHLWQRWRGEEGYLDFPASPVPQEYRWYKQEDKWKSAPYCQITASISRRSPYRMCCQLPQPYRKPRLDNDSAFSLASYFVHKNHEDKPWLQCIPSVFIRGTTSALATAWTEYKKGDRGIPQFKGKGTPLATLINNDAKSTTIDGEIINITKLGKFRIKGLSDRWGKQTKVCALKICCRPSGNYLQLTGNVPEKPAHAKRDRTLGIALIGKNAHHTTDTGKQVVAPRYMECAQKKLKKLQQKLARQEYLSQNWHKTKLKIGRLHEKIKAQRSKLNHKLSTYVVRTYRKIAIQKVSSGPKKRAEPKIVRGEYAPNGASDRTRKNRYLADLGQGQFVSFIEQKAKKLDIQVVKVETPFGDTRSPHEVAKVIQATCQTEAKNIH